MAKKFNPNAYKFTWLANELDKYIKAGDNRSIRTAAEKINRTAGTLTNWLNGVYLESAWFKPDQKDDVATLIAELLGCELVEVREQIRLFLISQKRIPAGHTVPNYKEEVAEFAQKIKKLYYYDSGIALSPEKRELIYATLALLEKI